MDFRTLAQAERSGGGAETDDLEEEVPFRCLHQVELGATVRVLRDAEAVVKACRKAGIGPVNQRQAGRSAGLRVRVLEKDSDNTVLCAVPEVGNTWFAVSALALVLEPVDDARGCAAENGAGGPLPVAKVAAGADASAGPARGSLAPYLNLYDTRQAAAVVRAETESNSSWSAEEAGNQMAASEAAADEAMVANHFEDLPEEVRKRLEEAERWKVLLEEEQQVDTRLKQGANEKRNSLPGVLIRIEERNAWNPNARTELFFCDAANLAYEALRKSLKKSTFAGLEDMEGRVTIVFACISALMPFRFLKSAVGHCQKLLGCIQGEEGVVTALQRTSAEQVEASLRRLFKSLQDLSQHTVGQTSEERLRIKAIVADTARVMLPPKRSDLTDVRPLQCNAATVPVALVWPPSEEGGLPDVRVAEVDRDATVAHLRYHLLEVFGMPADAQLFFYDTQTFGGFPHCNVLPEEQELQVLASPPLRHVVIKTTKGPVFRPAPQPAPGRGDACLAARLAGLRGVDTWPDWAARWFVGAAKVLKTTTVTAARLLRELRTRFQEDAFQERFQALHRAVHRAAEVQSELAAIIFAVQSEVIPKYGFEPSARGVLEMRSEMAVHADFEFDWAVDKLRRDVHLLLDMVHEGRTPLFHAVKRFHTVGDSHCLFGWPPGVIQHWQGPLLCYNAHRVDLSKLSPPLQAGDGVCLCLGEIDCRYHVHKQCREGRRYQDVINDIVAKYFEHLRAQVPLLPRDVRLCIFNVVPPAQECKNTSEYPFSGDAEEHRTYVLYFNSRLRKECYKAGYIFFDVYDQYTDEDGFLARKYSDGNVHIQDGRFIDRFLEGLGMQVCTRFFREEGEGYD